MTNKTTWLCTDHISDDGPCPNCVTPAPDVVRQPSHYTAGGIETIDYLQAKLHPDEFQGYLRGNCLKYLSRAGRKGDELEDYRKAAVYLDWLIKFIDSGYIK